MRKLCVTISLLSVVVVFFSSCAGQTQLSERTMATSTPTAHVNACNSKTARTPGRLTGHIAFADKGNDLDIYAMNADGSGRKQLTHDPGPQFDPDWSPDGKKIVYRDSRYGINNNDEIYVMNADGSGKINLTHNLAND